jgi:hypothetical protein
LDFLEQQPVNETEPTEYDAVVQQLRWVVGLQLKEYARVARFVEQEQRSNEELFEVLGSIGKLAKWADVAPTAAAV